MSKLPSPLRGVIPPMITPLKDYDTLDVEGVERLVEHILSGGVHGLFILGTTGNGPGLSYGLRSELIERVCKQVGERVPVLVGITDTAFVESVNVANKAAECGAAGLVLAHPYYLPCSQEEMLGYLERIAVKLPLPTFLYNMPSCTKLTFAPDMIIKAADIDGIVGLKDSSADMVYFHKLQTLLRDKPDFSLLVGPEELMGEAVLMGGHGGVSGGANIHPKLYVDLYNAAYAKDVDKVNELHNKVMDISLNIYVPSYLQGVKAAVSCLGICSDFMAEPFVAYGKEEKKIINDRLIKLGIKK